MPDASYSFLDWMVFSLSFLSFSVTGKISRVLAAKLSLCVRVDALTEAAETAAAQAGAASSEAAAQAPAEPSVAIACRRYVENKLEQLEQQVSGSKSYI